jgi:hypothetical protein
VTLIFVTPVGTVHVDVPAVSKTTMVLKPPLGAEEDQFVPSLVKTFPAVPALVKPVPPLATGKAVPDNETANVPEVVIGDPVTCKNAGTVIATLVTVPVPETVAQVGAPLPVDCNT